MAALSHELLTSDASDVSRGDLGVVITSFSLAVLATFERDDAKQQPPERIVQVLREATTIIPNSHYISLAFARCLTTRFQMTHVINEYEEAIAIADEIVAAHCPGDSLTPTQESAIRLIIELVVCRMNSFANPEYLEDSVHRMRNLLLVPSLPYQDRSSITRFLDNRERQRFDYFGVTGSSVGTPLDSLDVVRGFSPSWGRTLRQGDDDPDSRIGERMDDLRELLTSIRDNEITDIELAVECGRALLPSPHNRFSYMPALVFADILFQAHQRTNRLDYLDEAINAYRDLRNVSGFKKVHFLAANGLLCSLIARFDLSHSRQDIEEAMQLFPILAGDGYAEVFHRFNFSCSWAHGARLHAHPSILSAYKKAMTLMQETLIFSPTLQIQHFHLVKAFREFGGSLPSDYASYQIQMGQPKQAIETLERGRSLLWSEMRGLRTSTNQLRATDPALADKFTAINRNLEMVTMSITQSESIEIGDGEASNREGTDQFGRLLVHQRRLLEERDSLISDIQVIPGLENFLKPPSFDDLNSAASRGPVIIINQSGWRSDIIILLKDSPPSVISPPFNLHDHANRLKDQLLRTRNVSGLDSEDYGLTLANVLVNLYELVGKPVIERLRQLKVPEKSRVWWCPTSAFCSLPLHAMGPIPSDNGDELYFLDLYIPSYTPTLSALIESRKPRSLPESLDKPSLLLVAQPETLFGAWDEIGVIQSIGTPVTTLVSKMATPNIVVEGLRDHSFAHFVSHGLLETGKPFDASFELHGENLTLLEIVRSQLPAAELAFLSACHTAELTDGSIADESLHLVAAMQYCGFRSVIGTMWAMADTDGADLSKHFYKSIFLDRAGQNGMPYCERSARALQFAVKKLRKKRGITLERWVNFVHYGA